MRFQALKYLLGVLLMWFVTTGAWAQTEVSCNFNEGAAASSTPSARSTVKRSTSRAAQTARRSTTRRTRAKAPVLQSAYPAQVVAVRGDVQLVSRVGQVLGMPRQLKPYDQLSVNDEVQTLSRGFVSLRFADGSQSVLPSNAHIQLLEASMGVPRVKLISGAIESRVTKQPNARKSTFEIQLPVVTVGVRGTHFKVTNDSSNQRVSVEGGVVKVQQRFACAPPMTLNAGQGAIVSPVASKVMDLLDAPMLNNTEAAQREPKRMVFEVKPVEGAASYRVQVARDEAFLDVQQEALSSDTRVVVDDDDLPEGFYYVRVSAVDAAGLDGRSKTHVFLRSHQSN